MVNFNLTSQKFLGIDYGRKRIGLAVADLELKIAFPEAVIENKGEKFVVIALGDFCQKEKVVKIIVGMPYSLGSFFNQEQKNTSVWQKEVEKFAKTLKKKIKIPVILEDERLSTKIIRSYKKSLKTKVDYPEDAISAAVILQNYLDKN
ncbi:MAG: Holliday junction resolvase RuvX [bacterium]